MDGTLAPLGALAELERFYTGPVPEPLRLAAHLGSAERVELLLAEGQTAFFRAMARGQVAILRRRRKEHSDYIGLSADLALYRERLRHWRRRARLLASLIAAGAAP